MTLSANLDVQFDEFPDIPWTVTLADSFVNGTIAISPPQLNANWNNLLTDFGGQFLNWAGDIPILGPLSADLDRPLPLINESLAEIFGIDADLPDLSSLPTLSDLGLDGGPRAGPWVP